MKLFKRILSVCLLAVLLLFVMKEPSKAQTKTRETPYGTLTGTLNGYGGWVRKYGFKGTTTCSQNRNLFVAVEVRNNSNGRFENSKSNKKIQQGAYPFLFLEMIKSLENQVMELMS